MKKIKLLLSGLAAATLLLVGFAQLASAHSFRTGANVVIGHNETVSESLFVAGNSVEVGSEVFGDVFCAGQNVTISGTVHGDVICAGQTVNLTGKVDGDIRLAGQTVTVSGEVAGNATVASQTFTLSSPAKITGDITLGTADGTLGGSVGRDVAASGATLTVAGEVGRNVKGMIDNLQLTNSARVKGNVEFTSNNEANRADGAVIGGTITRKDVPKNEEQKRAFAWGAWLGWFIYSLLAMLVTALVLTLLFPRLFHNVTNNAVPAPWMALLTGFVASLAVPVILIMLVVTVIGIPLAFTLGLIWLLVVLLSGPVFAYYLGRVILQNPRQPLLIMLTGSVVLIVLYFIPLIGFFATLAAVWFGSGMLLLEAFNRTPQPVYTLEETAPSRTAKKSRR